MKTQEKDFQNLIDWNFETDNAQDFGNDFENKLIGVVDKIVPLRDHLNNFVKLTLYAIKKLPKRLTLDLKLII